MANSTLAQIELPSGSVYDLEDSWARERIGEMGSMVSWLGITTTTGIEDGADWTTGSPKTIKPISINGENVTPRNGDVIQTNYEGEGSREYILSVTMNGTAIVSAIWQEFGDLTGLGDLAWKDNASGSVSVPTSAAFTGTNKSHTFTGTLAVPTSATFTGDYYKLSGSVEVPSELTSTSTPGHTSTNATITEVSSGENMQAKGTVSAPTISVKTAGSTTSIKNPSAENVVKTISASTPASADATGEIKFYEISGKKLILKKFVASSGDSITTENVTVKTGDAAYKSSTPAFTGQKYLVKYDKTTSVTTGTSISNTSNAAVAISSSAGTSSNNTFQAAGEVELTNENKSVSVSGNVKATGTVALTDSSKTVTVS